MFRARIRLAPDLANLIPLENFIWRCGFLDATERDHCILIATEYFDNIARYSERVFATLPASPVEISIGKKGDEVSIMLRYGTRNFSDMIRAVDTTAPHYDRAEGRYRGLGLRMCGNLASSITYKKGLFKSGIIIIL